MFKLAKLFTNARRCLHVDQEGRVGVNLPFQTRNKIRLVLTFAIVSGFFFNLPVLLAYNTAYEKGKGSRPPPQECNEDEDADADADDEEGEC